MSASLKTNTLSTADIHLSGPNSEKYFRLRYLLAALWLFSHSTQ